MKAADRSTHAKRLGFLSFWGDSVGCLQGKGNSCRPANPVKGQLRLRKAVDNHAGTSASLSERKPAPPVRPGLNPFSSRRGGFFFPSDLGKKGAGLWGGSSGALWACLEQWS